MVTQQENRSLKNYRALPDYEALVARWVGAYDKSNYEGGLASLVLKRTHALIERPFDESRKFDTVLEVGAGTLAHLPFVRHAFDRYIASDFDQTVLDAAAARHTLPPKVVLQKLDGAKLPFADNSIDRVIATHVLEHVPHPHLAVEEWVRVLKPSGVLSLILPCDPGMAWRLGRNFGPRRNAEAAGLPYDYYMAREHVNSIFGLRAILDFHFPKKTVYWWPFGIPVPDINLIYAGNFYV